MTERIGDWIQTFTGLQFYPRDPRPEDICIEDIAHALSLICRFNGHIKDFYSVAEHSVFVSHLVDKKYALQGLLHDASEAWLCDLPRPIKGMFPEYRDTEHVVELAVADKFGIDFPYHSSIKEADIQMLSEEANTLLAHKPLYWNGLVPTIGINIRCLPPKEAEQLFLNRYYELTFA